MSSPFAGLADELERDEASRSPFDGLGELLAEPEEQRARAFLRGPANPDARAKALELSRQVGLPADVVERRHDDAMRALRVQRTNGAPFERIRRDSALLRFFSDPDSAAIAHDDLDPVIGLADAFQHAPEPPEVDPSMREFLAARFKRGERLAFELPDAAIPIMLEALGGTKAGPGIRERFDLLRQEAPVEKAGVLPLFLGDAAEQLPILASSIIGMGKGAIVGAGVGAGAALVGGQLGPQAALPEELATVPAGAGFGARVGAKVGVLRSAFQTEAAAAFLEFLQLKDDQGQPLSEADAAAAAIVVGGLNAAIEVATLGPILKTLPGVKQLMTRFGPGAAAKAAVVSQVKSAALRAALRAQALQILKATGVEAGEEIAQELVNIEAGRIASGQGVGLTAEEAARAGEAGLAAARATLTLGVAASPATVAVDQISQARANAAHLERVERAAQATKLLGRSPQTFDALMERLGEKNDRAEVGIPADELLTLYQDHGGLEALDEDVPGARAQLDEALATGGDVQVPVGQYVRAMARRLGDEARRHVRLTPGDLTLAEAEELEGQRDAEIERFAEEAADAREADDDAQAAEAYFDLVERQLRDAGEAPAVARAQAELLTTSQRVRAQRLGTPLRQLLSEENVRIEGPNTAQEAPRETLRETVARLRAEGTREAARAEVLRVLREVRTGEQPELKGLRRQPVLGILKARGGVDPASPLASELEAIGVQRRGKGSVPGLFRKGGLRALDELDLSTEPVFAAEVARAGESRLDPQVILDAVDAELRGQPLRSEQELEAITAAHRPREELLDILEELGLSLSTQTDEEIVEQLTTAAERFTQPVETEPAAADTVAEGGIELAVSESQTQEPAPGGSSADLWGSLGSFVREGDSPALPEGGDALEGGTRVRTVETGRFRTGITRVESAEDVAHVVAPLRKEAQESVLAVVTDDQGEILRILRHTIGVTNESLVNPVLVLGPAFETQGASSVWLVHNHPSGIAGQSDADHAILLRLANLTRDSGIRLRGSIVVAPGGRATFRDLEGNEREFEIAGSVRSAAVGIFQRRIARVPTPRMPVNSPRAAAAVLARFAPQTPGLLLLDARSQPVAFVRMSLEEMRRLRGRGVAEGVGRILRSAAQGNAISMIAQIPSLDLSTRGSALVNLGRFGTASGLQLNDALDFQGRSALQEGLLIGDRLATFEQPRGPEEEGVRGSITFDPRLRETVIRLTEARDLSTVLHESGHLFLAQLSKDAARTDAPEAIRQDLAAALEWLGVESIDQVQTEHQERFARGFEAYLFEGKAPSVALEGLFARFRAWLLRVYQAITRLNAPLSDEIRGVFDRLLASDEEIAAVQSSDRFRALFDKAEDAGMTEAEFERYRRAEEAARGEAQRELDRRLLAEVRREREAWWREERARVRAEVEREVNARPVFRAKHFLMHGEGLPGTVLPEGIEPMKLSREALVQMYGPEVVRALPAGQFSIWRAEGGVHPDRVAGIFGFGSGDEMVQAIAASGRRQEVIEQETDARMQSRHGDLRASGAIEDAALEASMGEERLNLLLTEERVLARATSRPPSPRRILAETARRVIREKRVRDLRPGRYAQAAEREARAAIEAAHAGDLDAARTHKRRQVLNMLLEREARRAKQDVEKAVLALRRFERPRIRERLGKAGGQYLAQIDALLERFDLGRVTDKAARKRQNLADWIREQEEAGQEVVIDPALRDETLRSPYRELPVGDLLALRDAVENIDALARLKKKLLDKRWREEFDAVADQVAGTIRDRNRALPKSANLSPDIRERLVSGLRDFHARSTKMEFLAWKLDGGEDLGPVWRALFQPIAEAEEAELARYRMLAPQLEALWSRYSPTERSRFKQRQYVAEVGLNLSKENLLAVALNVGNEGNRTALLEGHSWTEEQLDAVLARLEDRDWQTVQGIWDFIDSFWPEIAELQRELTGVAPERVERTPVQTRFGEFRGGYYPLVADANRSHRAFQLQQKEQSKDLFANNYLRPSTRKGHTIERVGFGGQPVQLDLSVLARHVQNVVHDLTHRRAILDVNRLVEDDRVRGAITETAGREVYQQIRPWLQQIARDYAPTDLGGLGKLITHVRTGSTIVNMGLKVTTGMAQLAGVLPSIERIGWRAFASGFRQAIGDGNPEQARKAVDFVLERSEMMRNRQTTFDRDARDLLRGLPKDGFIASRNEFFMKLSGLMDMLVSVPTWLGAYEQGMAEFRGDERKAVLFADQVVRQTQAAGSAKDLAFFQRGGDLARLMTQFYSYFSGLYNMLAVRISQLRSGQMSLSEFALSMTYLWFVPAVLGELLAARGPDDDEDWLAWAVKKQLVYPWQSIVGVRDIVRYFESQAEGKPFEFKPLPALDAFGTPVAAVVQLGQDVAEGDLRRSTLRKAVDSIGFWAHLPTRQAWITGEAAFDALSGEDVDLLDFLFQRPIEERAR